MHQPTMQAHAVGQLYVVSQSARGDDFCCVEYALLDLRLKSGCYKKGTLCNHLEGPTGSTQFRSPVRQAACQRSTDPTEPFLSRLDCFPNRLGDQLHIEFFIRSTDSTTFAVRLAIYVWLVQLVNTVVSLLRDPQWQASSSGGSECLVPVWVIISRLYAVDVICAQSQLWSDCTSTSRHSSE